VSARPESKCSLNVPPKPVAPDTQVQTASVSVCIASLNTAQATELCVRSARRLAGYPLTIQVGDCGSSDGSLDMLRNFGAMECLSLEVAPSGRYRTEGGTQEAERATEIHCMRLLASTPRHEQTARPSCENVVHGLNGLLLRLLW